MTADKRDNVLIEDLFPGWEKLEQGAPIAQAELDALPYGAIELSPTGTILQYSATEAKLSGRDPQKVLGRNFFTQVAPCTDVQEFAGKFRKGVAQKQLNEVIPFRFYFVSHTLDVWVRFFFSQATDSAWVLVQKRAPSDHELIEN